MFFNDLATPPTLRRAERAGVIRRLASGIWTADLVSEPETIIAENIWEIVARELPDAIVVDRSAACAGRIDGGIVTVATDQRASPLELPGVTVVVRPRVSHPSDTVWSHGLTASAPARALVDNLADSRARGRTARTLARPELLDWLAGKFVTWGTARMKALHSGATQIAVELGHIDRIDAIHALFDELEGRHPLVSGATPYTRAVVAGTAWDVERLAMFDIAAQVAAELDLERFDALYPDGELPFFEAYFSNYIEGTEFTIEDARQIVETQVPPARRAADGHDILGTHRCVVDPIGRARTSLDPDELVELMRSRHRTIMVGRPDIGPGEFKDTNNRVGSVAFVDPRLVPGTLARGLATAATIPAGFARAAYVMFVLAEIHPFTDGNGRTARLMMNAELSAVDGCRIVIPTVLRDEYMTALRRASAAGGDITVLADVLAHAWRWTATMPWTDRAATDGQLAATNALVDSKEAAERHVHLLLP